MSKSFIKLPPRLLVEFNEKILLGEVVVQEIGTFYVTEYKKEHPSKVPYSPTNEYEVKNRKVSKVSFRPHVSLKTVIASKNQ